MLMETWCYLLLYIPLEDGTEGTPVGVLYAKEEDKLSQLLREVFSQLPLATTRS